ncbi:MAG: SUMF1/EgtB/PvdO family nonheme iron enzyme [Chloroflexota bacterium]
MSRGSNYGYVGRRSGGAAWQWIVIGMVLGFGCSVVLVLVGLAGGVLSLDPNAVASNAFTATPFIITATAEPVTPTVAPTESPLVASPTQGILIEAPTATPTIDATFLTLQATSAVSSLASEGTQAALGAGTASTPNTASGGDLFAQLSSLSSELTTISGGTFTMGTNPSEVSAAQQECENGYGGEPGNCLVSDGDDSYPEHTVSISPFSMEVTEVSYAQFLTFMNSSAMGPGSHRNGCGGQACMATRTDSETSNIQFDANTYSVLLAINDFPMTNVTWYGAKAYCEAIGRRLPTEGEWEFAARGGSAERIFPWGNTWDGTLASTKRPADGSIPQAFAVLSFSGGATQDTGVLNMAGNVAEWVGDWYDPRFYGRPEATIPDPTGPVSGTEKVIRGGSWDAMPFYARTVHRQSQEPGQQRAHIGFRCVEDANSPAQNTSPLGSNTQSTTNNDLALPTTNPLGGNEETTSNSQPTLPPAPSTATQVAPVATLAAGG